MNSICIKTLCCSLHTAVSVEEEVTVRLSASWSFIWLIEGRRIPLKAVFHCSSCSRADEKTGQFTPAGNAEIQPTG